MERDFLGLSSNSMEPLYAVKREITEEETQWPFLKKASAFSQFISLRAGAGHDATGINKMNSSLTKLDFSNSVHNVADAMTRQQFLGVPMTVNSPFGRVTGLTEPWNNPKPAISPPQMTIFYAGMVSVFNEISPEKAQAIMLLAGNGSFPTSTTTVPSHNKVHSPSQPVISQSGGDELVLKNSNVVSSSSKGPISLPAMVPSAVPQFRKASLARFLEKRKERVMSTGPYACEKKHEGVFPANNNVGYVRGS